MLPTTLLITNKTNIAYLSRFRGSNGTLLLHKDKGYLFTDARYHIVAKKVLPSDYSIIDITKGFDEPWLKLLKKLKPELIGYEGDDISLALFSRVKKISEKIKFEDVKHCINELRMAKTETEIRLIKKAQSITDDLLVDLKKILKVGMSELDIAWKIRLLAHELGADDISFEPIVAINENAAAPHHQNSSRKLKKGDRLLLDMGVMFEGYCSDMTRVLFSKKPTPFEQNIYTIVWTAQEQAIAGVKAGKRGTEIDSIARNVIQEAGFGEYFTHSLGHGIGLDVHELPNLSSKYDKPLVEHSVVTSEPGIYIEGKIGIRLEDMIIVGEHKAVNITKSPKEIEACMIQL